MARATDGNAPSSTSNRPSSASRAESRVDAIPETRFAPESLWASRMRGDRIDATNAAVVGRPTFGLRPTGGVRPAGSTTSKGEDQRVPNVVNNALWGKKDGGARPRVIAAAIAAVVALAAPATVRAADVPASLLSQAQA